MGYASFISPCGCAGTRLMEPKEDIWIEWVKCEEHYIPEDDVKIVQAAKNKREHMKRMEVHFKKDFKKGSI
jgi:hypothetical protein